MRINWEHLRWFIGRLLKLRLLDCIVSAHGYPLAYRCLWCRDRRWWPMETLGAFLQQCPKCQRGE